MRLYPFMLAVGMLLVGLDLCSDCWVWNKQQIAMPPEFDYPSNLFFDENAQAVATVKVGMNGVSLWHYDGLALTMDWESMPELQDSHYFYSSTLFAYFDQASKRVVILGVVICGLECGYFQMFELVPARGWVPITGDILQALNVDVRYWYDFAYDSKRDVLVIAGWTKSHWEGGAPITIEFDGHGFTYTVNTDNIFFEEGLFGFDESSGKMVYSGNYRKGDSGSYEKGTLEYQDRNWVIKGPVIPFWGDYDNACYSGLDLVPNLDGLIATSYFYYPTCQAWLYQDGEWERPPISNNCPRNIRSGVYDPKRERFVAYVEYLEGIWEIDKTEHCRPVSKP